MVTQGRESCKISKGLGTDTHPASLQSYSLGQRKVNPAENPGRRGWDKGKTTEMHDTWGPIVITYHTAF